MQTYLQRPTNELQFKDTKQEIETLFNAAYNLDKRLYSQAIQHFKSILSSETAKEPKKYNPIELEMSYNILLAEIYEAMQKPGDLRRVASKCEKQFKTLLKDMARQQIYYLRQEQEQEWLYVQNLRIRIYTTALQLSIQSEEINLQQWLELIIQQLEEYPERIPEVFGKLCGCKYLKAFCQNFDSDHIIDNHQINIVKKAQMIDLASSWLILGGQLNKGITLKQLALTLWKQSNALKEYEKCQIELMQLKSNSDSQYCTRLKKLARITIKLIRKLTTTTQCQNNHIGLIVKKSMHKSLKQIDDFNQQLQKIEDQILLSKKKKNFWSLFKKEATITTKKSILKDSKLIEYYQKSNQFYQQILSKQSADQITSILANDSKFIIKQKNILSKVIVPLIQMFTKRRRYAFLIIKNCYIVKYGLLNPAFLNSLPGAGSQNSKGPKKEDLAILSSFLIKSQTKQS